MNIESKYSRAAKRVDNLRGFYYHLMVYLVVNLAVSTFKVLRNIRAGETLQEAIFDLGTFILWMAWGIGLALHAFSVFGLPMILGKDWENKKIRELMDKENKPND